MNYKEDSFLIRTYTKAELAHLCLLYTSVQRYEDILNLQEFSLKI